MSEQLPRFRLSEGEYYREPEERGVCSECFGTIAPDADCGMCDRCKRRVLDEFRMYLQGLSKNELEYLNDTIEGIDLRDIAGR